MSLLPTPNDPAFPSALKRAREAAGLSRGDLARKAKIHPTMPRRYEEAGAPDHTRPRHSTWEWLNRALGLSDQAATPSAKSTSVSLEDASTDQIVAELRSRGISATLTFPS